MNDIEIFVRYVEGYFVLEEMRAAVVGDRLEVYASMVYRVEDAPSVEYLESLLDAYGRATFRRWQLDHVAYTRDYKNDVVRIELEVHRVFISDSTTKEKIERVDP